MRSVLPLLMLAVTAACSSNQAPTGGTGRATSENASGNKKTTAVPTTYSQSEYAVAGGGQVLIQNGLPKGGIRLTDSKGDQYSVVVFWNRILNETDSVRKVRMKVPQQAYAIPSLPGHYYKVVVPPDTMTPEKTSASFYGLKKIEALLNNQLAGSESIQRKIAPHGSTGFYVVIFGLSEGAHGTMRTELSLKGTDLFYRMNVDGSKSGTPSADQQMRWGTITAIRSEVRPG